MNGTTIHQYLRNVCRKIALLKSLNFANSKEPNFHNFWATWLILVSKEAEFCDLKCYREFFFSIFEISKNYAVWNFSFLGKNTFFWKKYNSTTKIKFEKKTLWFCRAQNSASIDISINSVGWTIWPFGSLLRTPLFYVFCE